MTFLVRIRGHSRKMRLVGLTTQADGFGTRLRPTARKTCRRQLFRTRRAFLRFKSSVWLKWKKPSFMDDFFGADKRTWTSTELPRLAPEASASADSAISANILINFTRERIPREGAFRWFLMTVSNSFYILSYFYFVVNTFFEETGLFFRLL